MPSGRMMFSVKSLTGSDTARSSAVTLSLKKLKYLKKNRHARLRHTPPASHARRAFSERERSTPSAAV